MKGLNVGFLLAFLCISYTALQANTVDCGPDITVMNDTGSCDAMVTIVNPTSTDPTCVIVAVTNDFTNTNNATALYPVGTTEVVFTIQFSNGTSAQCSIDVEVQDNESPSLNCPVVSDVCDLTTIPIYSTLQEYLDAGGIATDNCGIVDASFAFVGESIDPPGTCDRNVTRTYSILDTDGNLSTCNQDFVFTDDSTPPVLTCPDDLTLSADNLCTAIASIPPVVSDDCGIDDINYTITGAFVSSGINDASNEVFELGVQLVTYSATDNCGNLSTCSFTITVVDNTAPVFNTVPTAIADINCNDPFPAFETLTATDNCDAALVVTTDQDFTSDICAGYPVTYLWMVTDLQGNTASTSTIFNVLPDTDLPSLDAGPSTPADITCDADFPAPDMLTASDGCSNAVVRVDTLPFTVDYCAALGYPVTYRYTPVDDCGNEGTFAEVTFNVLPDTEAPSVAALADLEFNNDTGDCSADLTNLLPIPTSTDNCSGVVTNTFVRMDTNDDNMVFPVGTTVITWTVTDACDNSVDVQQNVIITDNESPSITCNGSLLVVLGGVDAKITADQIVTSATDNCNTIESIEIQRMDNSCNNPDDLILGDCVTVCCADLNEVMIQAVVTDSEGNQSTCMVAVTVEDGVAPSVSCPADITVSCAFDFSTDDLSVFGSVEDGAATADDILIVDELYPTGIAGTDGVATDNCGITSITDAFVDNRTDCGDGSIIRTFTVTDVDGNTTTCEQSILVVNTDPFDIDDITWPDAIVELPTCQNANFEPSNTGMPTIANVNCGIIMMTPDDTVYDSPNSGCVVIERDWTVIDWCQYDPNATTPVGRFEFQQTIISISTEAPIFADTPEDVTLCFNNGSCTEANSNQTVSVSDECTDTEDILVTYAVDYLNDGSINLSGVGTSVLNPMPAGTHSITWTADDRCGNESSISYQITVQDCKAPSPVCINGLSTNLNNMPLMDPMIVIWARDFNASSFDNCTPTEDLIYSFSSDVEDVSRTFMCEDQGIQTIEMWVTDSEGNQAYCETFIDIQDNNNLCPDVTLIRIAGDVYRENGTMIEDAEMYLGFDDTTLMAETDEVGHFEFDGLPTEENYSIQPSYTSNYREGVSTLDIILIQRHLLSLQDLDSPYKMIAADVNNSNSITASDLVDIRKLILEVTDEFPNTDSWKFANANATFLDANHPWPYEEAMWMYQLDHDAMGSDFIAMKTGDVNNSTVFNNMEEDIDYRGSALTLSKRQSEANQTSTTEFVIEEDVNLTGFQIQLTSSSTLSEVKIGSEYLGLSQEHYNYDPSTNVLTISWNTVEGLPMESGDVLFDINTTDEWTLVESSTTEWYDGELATGDIVIEQMTTVAAADSDNMDLKSMPNPFTNATQLSFNVPTSGEVTLLVHNEVGELIYGDRMNLDAGTHSININKEDLGGTEGIYFCTLITETVRTTEKIFLIK